MTTQQIYDELLKHGYAPEFLKWFQDLGIIPPMPKRKEDGE